MVGDQNYELALLTQTCGWIWLLPIPRSSVRPLGLHVSRKIYNYAHLCKDLLDLDLRVVVVMELVCAFAALVANLHGQIRPW